MKMYNKESYEELIWDLIEDRLEFSEETKKNIAISQNQIKEGKTIEVELISESPAELPVALCIQHPGSQQEENKDKHPLFEVHSGSMLLLIVRTIQTQR